MNLIKKKLGYNFDDEEDRTMYIDIDDDLVANLEKSDKEDPEDIEQKDTSFNKVAP